MFSTVDSADAYTVSVSTPQEANYHCLVLLTWHFFQTLACSTFAWEQHCFRPIAVTGSKCAMLCSCFRSKLHIFSLK